MTTTLTEKPAKRGGQKKAPPASADAAADLPGDPPPEGATSAPPESITLIELDRIVPSPRNPRRLREDTSGASIREIAESIKSVGLLHPILVRMVDDHYEIIAGERRWRAARLAGLAAIPAIVRELDDTAALEITVVENMQREDLHPIEEARGLKELLDAGYTADDAAARLGKSRAWIACRAQLARLIPELAAAALGEDEHLDLSRWSVRALELVARLPEPTQQMLWEKLAEHIEASSHEKQRIEHATTSMIGSLAGRFMCNLTAAAWDPTATYGGIPPCAQCAKRSQAQPDLFGDGENEDGDRCLDPQCWDRKSEAHAEQFIAEAEQQYPGILKVSTDWRTDLPNVLAAQHYQRCREGAEGAVPAVVVEGTPEIVWIRIGSDGRSQRQAAQVTGAEAPSQADAIAKRKAQYDKLRRRIVMDLLAARLKELVEEGVGETCAVTPQKVMACVLATGMPYAHLSTVNMMSPWPIVHRNMAKTEGELMMDLAQQMAEAFDKRLHSYFDEPKWAEAVAIAELFGVNLDGLMREASTKKPYPISWRAQAELLPPSPIPESAFYETCRAPESCDPVTDETDEAQTEELTAESAKSAESGMMDDGEKNANENAEEKDGDADPDEALDDEDDDDEDGWEEDEPDGEDLFEEDDEDGIANEY